MFYRKTHTKGYDQVYPSIAIDSSDNLHVVWRGHDNGNSSNYQIKYSKYSGGSWSIWTNIQPISGYSQANLSIAIDSINRLHILWYDQEAGSLTYDQIKYSTCSTNCQTPANWSAWVNKTSNTTASQYDSTLRWSRWNNNAGSLDWGWTDGTTVMFNKDVTVNMSP